MDDFESVNLTNCDREPIHIPGSIQPQGCLLVCDKDLTSIMRHSANVAEFLSTDDPLIGTTLATLIGEHAVHALRNALTIAPNPARPGLVMALDCGSRGNFDVAVHRHGGLSIVEFERADGQGASSPLPVARLLVSRLTQFSDSASLLKFAPQLLRALVDYDRIMVYRFSSDGSGQVIAERKAAHLESFLGQFFPASDIPRQARELYLKNTLRIISDASCVRVPIEPQFDFSGEPLDLSFAHLRSVSPIHCEYLRNMGVAASMSISIIVSGRLWGLIACHHYAPKTPPMAQRTALELFGEFFSLTLQSILQKERLESAWRARRTLDGLLRDATYGKDDQFLEGRVETFMSLLPCDGVGLWLDGKWSSAGVAPPVAVAKAIARTAAASAEGRVWATHELAKHIDIDASTSEASGVLAIPLSQLPRDYLFFFRKEVVETIQWGGDPNKTYETGPLGDRLTPRKSFAIWKETVEGQSRPWTANERDIAEAARTALLEVIMRQTELLSAERRKADVRQKLLNEELNHRVKNILALIKSVVSQPTSDQTLDAYVHDLKGRIMALALAHDQVVRHDGGGSLRDLLAAELTPYRGSESQLVLTGPDIGLEARAYSVMALVIHELATNAAKYGALSTSEGRLSVSWVRFPEGACEVRWVETGGPQVHPPRRRGFGSILIDRSIPFDLGGESEIDYAPSGVVARFLLPARFVTAHAPRIGNTAPADKAVLRKSTPLDGLHIMLVEDQLVIAIDAENILAEGGVATVSTAATAAEALAIISRGKPDAAVLDVNLGMETSIPVAEELAKLSVPFVFATGYGDSANIPRSLAKAPVVRKPYEAQTLIAAIAETIAPKA